MTSRRYNLSFTMSSDPLMPCLGAVLRSLLLLNAGRWLTIINWPLAESESYVTTDGQSASLSWYKAPIRGLRPDFYFRTEYGIRLTVTFLIPWAALSDKRTGLSFVCAAGPCQRILSRVLVPWDLRPYFTVSDLRLPWLSRSIPLSRSSGLDREHLLSRLYLPSQQIGCIRNA
jgi:hypothetical protein